MNTKFENFDKAMEDFKKELKHSLQYTNECFIAANHHFSSVSGKTQNLENRVERIENLLKLD
jgi:hypothetical protein